MPDTQTVPHFDLSSLAGRQAALAQIQAGLAQQDAPAAVAFLAAVAAATETESIQRELDAIFPGVALLALPLVPETLAVELLDRYLTTLLDHEPVALKARLLLTLEAIPLRSRDAFKQQVLERLRRSNVSLTTTPIQSASGATLLPTVGNWLKLYLEARANTPSPDGFLAAQPNASHFSSDDRQRLAAFVVIVQRLAAASTTLEGLEDSVPIRQASGSFGVLTAGQVTPLGATPTAATSPAGRFAFHPDDERELAAHAGRLKGMNLTAPSSNEAAEAVAAHLLRAQQIAFSDGAHIRRFRTALVAYLKSIRSAQETREILTRPLETGGLGLTSAQADAVLAAAAQETSALTDPAAFAELRKRIAATALSAASLEEGAPPPDPSLTTPPPPTLPDVPARPSTIRRTPVPPPTGGQRPPSPGGLRYEARALPVRMTRPRPTESDRPFLADIRAAGRESRPRTMGPVDELKALTLDEFRSAGATEWAIRKLKERFDALSKESYSLRVQGIIGWRQSPLYGLYLELGNESMVSQRPIRVVIAARQAQGQPVLTENEFAAIADLNQTLRF